MVCVKEKKKKNRKKKIDLKSEAAVISKKPPSEITKEEQKLISMRIKEIKKYNADPSIVQNCIPYKRMFKNGICQVSDKVYSKSIQFYDLDYALTSFEKQNEIFAKYCEMLNYFDSDTEIQFSFESQRRPKSEIKKIIQIPSENDEYSELRDEYNELLADRLAAANNGAIKRYITFSVTADSYSEAKSKLLSLQYEISKMLGDIGVDSSALTGIQRLETLYYTLNPQFSEDSGKFVFDWERAAKSGLDTKDFIAPHSIEFGSDYFKTGDTYGAVMGFNILSSELPDNMLKELLEQPHLFCFNISVEPFDLNKALKLVNTKISDVNKMKIDEQKKASKNGYDPDILPEPMKAYIEDMTDLLKQLQEKNEKLFIISITLRNYAKTKKQLKLYNEKVRRLCQKNNCSVFPLKFRQESAFASTLPLGYKDNTVTRQIDTSGIACFVPFLSAELFDPEGVYYGMNAASGNMVMADRRKKGIVNNPNGLILGVPGGGKSFLAKREILDVFFRFPNDDQIICDPENEYSCLVKKLGGQVIELSSDSEQHINPMDINFSGDTDGNPIAEKAEFIVSVCEIIVGGKYGLEADERSVIDAAVRSVYNKFLNNNPSKETMPTFKDLYYALKKQGETASRVANSLEMYVLGTQSVFNYRTNVDIDNRIICFDLHKLKNQLKKLAMLIVNEMVWNRIEANRHKKKFTWYYVDEFHLLLRDEQTANYSIEMWKRLRKWYGIPTGITQNVKDLLMSPEIENIFENSDFVYMLSQASGDREILSAKLGISYEQQKYIENAKPGSGLIKFGRYILPIVDEFPKNTKMYELMTTSPSEHTA